MQQLPDHAIVPGLGGQDASGGSPEGMAAGVLALLDQLPHDGVGLAISHTPLVERAAFGLTGIEIAPLQECEGILVRRDDEGVVTVEELRLGGWAGTCGSGASTSCRPSRSVLPSAPPRARCSCSSSARPPATASGPASA
jgi:hypothetical protein